MGGVGRALVGEQDLIWRVYLPSVEDVGMLSFNLALGQRLYQYSQMAS
jgi:hypothetical protein